jgi:outer membrane immunogenic protein
LAGGQAGYRWQTANWVFGIEAQGDWADLKGSTASLTAVIPYTNRSKIDAIGLFTGQGRLCLE